MSDVTSGDDVMTRFCFTLPNDLHEKWKAAAAARGISMSAYAREAAEEKLAEWEAEKPGRGSKK
jgi:hypothetical protein